MNERVTKAGWLAAAGLALFMAQAAPAETLTDALVSAYNNSHLLEQNRAVLRAADEDVAQAVSALRPTLEYGIAGGYEHLDDPQPGQLQDAFSTSLDLFSRMTIWSGGRNRMTVEAQKEAVLAAREGLIAQEQQVLFDAVTAYMNVIAARETVDLQQNSVRVLQEEVRAATDRFDVGEVTRTDVAQAQARLAQADADLVTAQGEYQIAREDYKLRVGRYPGNLASPPPLPRTAATLDAARDVAQKNHPQILQAQFNVTFAELNVAIAEAAVLPTLSGRVGGNYSNLDTNTFRTDGYDWGASVGVELGGTIYQGGALNSVFRQSKANRDNSRAALLQTTATVGEQVGRAWAVRESAGAALSATERQIQAAQIAFDGTREEATLGARTTLDVLDAEQDLLNARTSRVNAASQEQIAVYGVLASMGRLTVDYLKLPVTAYDPSVYYNSVRNAPGGVTSSQGIKLDRVLKSIGQY